MRKFNVTVNGKSYAVEVEEVGGAAQTAAAPVVSAAPAAAPAPVAGEGTPVKAPLPGLVLSLAHANGDTVKKDEKILSIESMKMENDVPSTCAGVITYAVKKGDKVETGDIIAYVK